jgi:long-subunit fatty acid transport protein
MPLQAVAGLAYQATPSVKLLADYQFVQWSKFDTLVIDGDYLDATSVEAYKNTHGLRLGTEISLDTNTVARAGINIHGAAAPNETVTPLLPEGKRQEFSVGLGRQLTRYMRLDAAYTYLKQPERAGRSTEGANNGVYNFKASLFGVALSFAF